MKKIIMTIITALLLGVSYFGMTNYLENKAEAEDVPTFTAYTYEYDEYGYIPRTDIRISKNDLVALLSLKAHRFTRLNSGDCMVEFEMETNRRWIVKISDPVDIGWLRGITPID